MINCPLCNSNKIGNAIQSHIEPGITHEFSLHDCMNCGIQFWIPLIMPPASYYENAIGDYEEFHTSGSDEIKWWHKTFMENFPNLHIKGKVLDIGCADGRLLKALQYIGWDVFGIDFDSRSVEVAKKKIGNERVKAISLEEFIQISEPNSFDLITFFEVLEHQTDPIKFINDVLKLLKPGGMIAGSVPNNARYIVRKRFSPDNPPHHFTLWKKEQLINFFNRMNCEEIKVVNTRYEPILLDQLVRSFFLKKITEEKNKIYMNSKRETTFVSGNNSSGSIFIKLKKIFWTPIYRFLGLFEYPYLFLTKKSISLYFHCKLMGKK